jgi:anti-sigma factor RsiW
MTCDTCQAKIEPYVDSELPGDELANFEAHLRECPACAADALGRLQMKRMTQAAGSRYTPSPEFRLRIKQSITPKRKWSFLTGWIPKLAAVAVAVVLIVGSSALWLRHSERQRALTEIADLHVATLASANPVDVISTDQHTVKPWFAGKLPFTFNIPDLQNSPFKLAGGRVAYFEHNPAAQLLLDYRKHQISVFIFQDRNAGIDSSAGVTTYHMLSFNIETWAEGGLRYVVITDAEPAAVRELGDLFRRAAQS